MKKLIIFIMLVTGMSFSMAGISSACVSPPPPTLCEILPDSICKVLTEEKTDKPLPGGQYYEVVVSSFITFGSQEGESCGISLGEFDIGVLVHAEVQTLDGKTLKGFNFKENKLTAKSITLGGMKSSNGKFNSSVSGILTRDIPKSKWVKLVLGIKTPKKVSKEKLNAAIRNAIFATGSTNYKGQYDGEHLKIMRLEMKQPNNPHKGSKKNY